VVAEPSSGAGPTPEVLLVPDLLLGAPGWVAAHRPERVLVVGRPTLSRSVGRLIAGSPSDVVARLGGWPDPTGAASRVLPAVPAHAGGPVDPDWLATWQDAAAAADDAAAPVVEAAVGAGDLVEAVVAGRVAAACPPDGLLVVGSSKPVRDLFLAGPSPGVTVLANRGVAGIDGMVSTAVGAALAHAAAGGGAGVALLGDLTFLHDANGLVLGPAEPRPDLTIVVVHNDGGAIFGLLEQADAASADAFERVFGTPHGVDLAALCAATGTPHVRVDDLVALDDALAPAPGLRVVEARTDRAAAVALDRDVRAAVAAALG
jgi:2-succinyl-5-enolpyruvyl-6-hydroxy-3-cyclohexene-1-carboxylate synthase